MPGAAHACGVAPTSSRGAFRRGCAGGHDDDGGGLLVRSEPQSDQVVASQCLIDPAVSASLARLLNLAALYSIGLRNQVLKLAPAHDPKSVEASFRRSAPNLWHGEDHESGGKARITFPAARSGRPRGAKVRGEHWSMKSA